MLDEKDLLQNTEGQDEAEVRESAVEAFAQEEAQPVVTVAWDGSETHMEEGRQEVRDNSQETGDQSIPQPGDGQGYAYYDTSAPQEIIAQIPKEYKTEAEKLYEANGWLPGGFWVRYFARMLDLTIEGILAACGYLSATILFDTAASRPFFFDFPLGVCFGILFSLIYETMMVKWTGATLGKMALRLRVVDVESGAPLTWWQSFFRASFGKLISDWTVVGGLLIFGKDHRTLNDRLTDSCVVYR